jgi:hypothetical protein
MQAPPAKTQVLVVAVVDTLDLLTVPVEPEVLVLLLSPGERDWKYLELRSSREWVLPLVNLSKLSNVRRMAQLKPQVLEQWLPFLLLLEF